MTTVFEDVVNLFGTEAAQWLQAHYPGKRVWVPTNIRSFHPMAELGETGRSLAFHYGGTRICVPESRKKEAMLYRDQQIYKAWRSGAHVRELARLHGMSGRNVYKIIDRAKSNGM
jgi:hypothetical protein